METHLVGVISLILAILALTSTYVNSEQFSFDGYKVWSVNSLTEKQQQQLLKWSNNENVDFWDSISRVAGKSIRIMVAPNTQNKFEEFLQQSEIKNEIILTDLNTIFDKERESYAAYQNKSSKDGRFIADFNHFWSLREINDYLTFLFTFHGDICSTQVVGHSKLGKLIRSITISLHGRGQIDGSRPIVYIDAGIHAREWATHTTTMFILHELLENRNEHRAILESIDFVIIPVANPDGYEHSWNEYRLWRKTRARVVREDGQICYGIDGNRNYEHMWREGNNPCSDTYPGTHPFSEPETQAVRSVFEKYGKDIKVYLSIHSYGEYVLYPWGYDRVLIENWQLHDDVGRLFGDAILEATGTNYTVGNGAIVLYPAYGASDDYFASVGVQLSYTLELPGGGSSGFDLPAYRMQEVAIETWIGVKEIFEFAGKHDWESTEN